MGTATIKTNLGTITFRLLPELAPETARNFESLASADSTTARYSTGSYPDL